MFRQVIKANVENVERFTFQATLLHNYLHIRKNALYTPTRFVDSKAENGAIIREEWRAIIAQDGGTGCFKTVPHIKGSEILRYDALGEYYLNEEAVVW